MDSKEINLSEVVKQYSSDVPSPELVDKELLRWKSKYSSVKNECLPSSPSAAIKECDADLYPHVLLQIACTFPVTSCECERSASVLRRLNNYMRSCMGKERLANLALLHIHYEQIIDVELVVDTFARLHPRRLELDSLIVPSYTCAVLVCFVAIVIHIVMKNKCI